MTAQTEPVLFAHGLTVAVPNRILVEDLEVGVGEGEFLAVLGQNGAGKSLTLHTLAGLRAAERGEVLLHGKMLGAMSRRDIARKLALLPQHTDDVFPATVLETALIGRHPHIGLLQWESLEDRRIAADALDEMDLGRIPDRGIDTLSGGERRRLAIAQTLTQAPIVYLLDEPTNHLDPQHQFDVLSTFRRLADAGATIVASFHDVNLAAQYADTCLLLFGDGRWEYGATESILSEDRLTALYGIPVESIAWRDTQLFVAAMRPDRSTSRSAGHASETT